MRRIQGSAMFLIWSIRFHLGTNFFCPTYNFPEDICNLSFFSLVNVSLLASNLKIDNYRMISAKGCGALQHTGIDRAPRPHFSAGDVFFVSPAPGTITYPRPGFRPGTSFSCPRPPVRSPIPGPGFRPGTSSSCPRPPVRAPIPGPGGKIVPGRSLAAHWVTHLFQFLVSWIFGILK